MWEQHNVTLFKNPNYGYGIAISGGSDSNNKDSSIYISDVVQGGPAENKLKYFFLIFNSFILNKNFNCKSIIIKHR